MNGSYDSPVHLGRGRRCAPLGSGMASIAPEWVVTEPLDGSTITVLVAESDAETLLDLSEELTRRGFVVIPASTWSAAANVMAVQDVDIAVVQSSLPDLWTMASRRERTSPSADRRGQGGEIPLIFTVGDTSTFDWTSFSLLDRADYVLAPTTAADLAQRVDAAALRLRRRASADLRAERLRSAVRRVSTAIQSTREPAAMAALLVSGVVDVFDVRQVYLHTFPDDRVEQIGLEGRRGEVRPAVLDEVEHLPVAPGRTRPSLNGHP